MKKGTMQSIQDFYVNLGYKGSKLRETLTTDKNYQELLKAKRQELKNNLKISPAEIKKYALATDVDFEILSKCKKLEKMKLEAEDKDLVKFIKTQLEDDWRTPLIKKLKQLLKKYK